MTFYAVASIIALLSLIALLRGVVNIRRVGPRKKTDSLTLPSDTGRNKSRPRPYLLLGLIFVGAVAAMGGHALANSDRAALRAERQTMERVLNLSVQGEEKIRKEKGQYFASAQIDLLRVEPQIQSLLGNDYLLSFPDISSDGQQIAIRIQQAPRSGGIYSSDDTSKDYWLTLVLSKGRVVARRCGFSDGKSFACKNYSWQ
jgi:hypothetical protein